MRPNFAQTNKEGCMLMHTHTPLQWQSGVNIYAHCITESCTLRCTRVHIQYRCLHLCKLTMCDRAYIRLRLLKIYTHICTCTHHRCKSVYPWRHSLSQLHGYNCMWLTLQIGVYRLYSIPMSHNSIIWWSTAWSNSTSSLTYRCTLNEIAHIYTECTIRVHIQYWDLSLCNLTMHKHHDSAVTAWCAMRPFDYWLTGSVLL